jgi:hypothetical protein
MTSVDRYEFYSLGPNHMGVIDHRVEDAIAQHWRDTAAAAQREFEQTATELAGDDHTLRRVLLARLHRAYQQGKRDEAEVELVRLRADAP